MREIDFTIGADPEFCVTRRGYGTLYAGDFGSEQSRVGCDGNGDTFEIRPSPSACPIEVVKNIKHNLVRAISQYPSLSKTTWLAGSYKKGYPLGGHIHFGTKRKIAYRTATGILSQYVATMLLLVENESEARSRRAPLYGGHRYGLSGDFRGQPYGFEYRTPSSWLASPHMAAAALCLSKVVMYETLNNKKFSPQQFVPYSYIDDVKIKEVRDVYPKIWGEIIKMRLYPKYKKEIDYLHSLIIYSRNWHFNQPENFRIAWKITMPKNVLTESSIQDIWSNT